MLYTIIVASDDSDRLPEQVEFEELLSVVEDAVYDRITVCVQADHWKNGAMVHLDSEGNLNTSGFELFENRFGDWIPDLPNEIRYMLMVVEAAYNEAYHADIY